MRATLGHFGALGDPFGVTLGHFGGATLGDLWTFWGDFGVTFGPLWGHFGATWGLFLAYEGRCRGLWKHFELTLGSLLAYENEFGIIMVSSYAHEAQFSKTSIFQMNFNGFLKVLYPCAITLRLLCSHIEAILGI